jgi:hypothetical protein
MARFRRFDVVLTGRETDEGQIEALRERREGMRSAMGDLEHAVAAPAPGRLDEWIAGVRSALDALRDVIDHHVFATEAPGGFLDEIVDDEPRLANQSQRLRDDHGEIVDAVSVASAQLRSGPAIASDEWVEAQRDRLLALLALLARHRQRGADLVYEAYSLDIGAGG